MASARCDPSCGPALLRRIAVIGTSGSGKTTLAKAIAAHLGHLYIELDALHFEAGWREVPDEVFRARVTTATAGETWIVDGNYGAVRDLIWAHADTIVWLDYPRHVVMRRIVWRTVTRGVMGTTLWHGNRERLFSNLVGANGMIHWAWTTWPTNRQRYSALLLPPATPRFAVVHLRTPRETSQWLRSIRRQTS